MSLISSSASHSSAFVGFLLARLLNKNHSIIRMNLNRMSNNQERRIFFLRLQKMRGAIPHPIFSKSQLDFGYYAKILFARRPEMLKMLTCMQREAAFKYEPTKVKQARSLLLAYIGQKQPFVIKLHDDKNKVILLSFRPERVNVWSCTLTWVDRNKCISCTLESVKMTMNITTNIGVILDARTFNVLLFYTKNLKLRVHSSTHFEDEGFFASHVEFYVQRPQAES